MLQNIWGGGPYTYAYMHDMTSSDQILHGDRNGMVWQKLGWLVFNGTFSKNRLYHAMDVSYMSFWAGYKYSNKTNKNTHSSIWFLCRYSPRLAEGRLSSEDFLANHLARIDN